MPLCALSMPLLPGSELAIQVGGYATAVAAIGTLLTKLDNWSHGPARLKKDIDAINRRLDIGNDRYSTGIGKVNTKISEVDTHLNAVDLRVTRLEALDEARHDSPRPRTR